jgi:hypothetical protein
MGRGGLVGKRGRTRRVVVEGEVAVIEETESLLVSCFIRYWRRRKMRERCWMHEKGELD